MLTVEIAERGDAALLRRAAGRYYTPECIGRPLAQALAARIRPDSSGLRIVDPFAGDGRLVLWFLQEAASRLKGIHVEVELWDVDGPAVATAVEVLEAESRRTALNVSVTGRSTDSFRYGTKAASEFDVVITNPPWERLKPDPRELADLSEVDRDSYVSAIGDADRFLGTEWPLSQPTRKWGGWGTNLSRVGLQVAHSICRPGGVMGVVIPSSFMADSTSVPLRRHILSEAVLHEVAFYPAEMRVWDGADVDSVTIAASKEPGQEQEFVLRQVNRSTHQPTTGTVTLTPQWLRNHDWSIPVTIPPNALRIVESLGYLHPLGRALVGNQPLRLGRELDESGHSGWTAPDGDVPFIKGRDVGYMKISEPSLYLTDPDRGGSAKTRQHTRFVWRDVTRPSQARRLVPAVLGPGPVTGNSVGIGWVANEDSALWATAVASLMASVVLETQARALLATNHMSKSVVAKLKLPRGWAERAKDLAKLGDELRRREPEAQPKLEVAVGQLFGLSLEDWSAVADAVPGADDRLREGVANRW